MKFKPWVKFSLFILFFVVLFLLCPNLYDKFKTMTYQVGKKVEKQVVNITEQLENKKIKQKEYEECLNKPYDSSQLNEEINTMISSLDNYIKNNYNMGVKYKDLKTGFNYYYKPQEMYYAASTIKLLDGLYIYKKAALNELSLDETVLYESKYVLSDSKGMKTHKVGDKVTLRELVKYAIIYSDNSAHQMLVSYIGFNNLKQFGNDMGATTTLVGGDNFGYINANDGAIYLEYTYNFIEENEELGNELKEYLINAEINAIKYPDLNIDVGHKYGFYKNYFNDLGIVYDENPYVISILTAHGNDDHVAIVNDISKRINEIHNKFKELRINACKKM